jgi:hypothetical protein
MLAVRPKALAGCLCLAALAAMTPFTLTGKTSAQKPAAAANVYSPVGTEEVWKPGIWKSYMTDEERPVVLTKIAGTDGLRFDVEATCINETWLDLTIKNETPNRNLLRADQPRSSSSNSMALFGGSVETSSTVGAARSCVQAQVRAGDGDVKEMVSESCDKGNVIDLNFKGAISKERLQQSLKEHPEYDTSSYFNSIDRLAQLFSPSDGKKSDSDTSTSSWFTDMLLSENNADDGTLRMADFLAASRVRIGMPLEDGGFTTFDLHPQQSVFKAYAEGCMSKAPKPIVAVATATPTPPPNRWHPVDGLNQNGRVPSHADSYRGTADELSSSLGSLISKALKERGLPPDLFDSSIASAQKRIGDCSTPSTASNPACHTRIKDHWWQSLPNDNARHLTLVLWRGGDEGLAFQFWVSPLPDDEDDMSNAHFGYCLLQGRLDHLR